MLNDHATGPSTGLCSAGLQAKLAFITIIPTTRITESDDLTMDDNSQRTGDRESSAPEGKPLDERLLQFEVRRV